MAKQTFYVTTPIYYVTARPHLGSLYSTLLADVAARWNHLHGKQIFFLTGTDEHGQKVADAAQQAGKRPQEFVDSFIPAYKHAWNAYELEYTHFIRTTDTHHVKAVQAWLEKLIQTGDVYKGAYTGWYCTPCETFVTEKEDETQKAGQAPKHALCGRETHAVSEETYFFKLSAYQERLLQFYADNPDFIVPKERAHEVINFVKAGLHDFSLSRTTVSWGIPFPNDPTHVTYVWADALNNYITAIGYGDNSKREVFEKWWPADVQILGKDIVRFHAIYWPAFLMASGLPLPKQLLVHGWIKVGDQKMSKSLGNVVDPLVLLEKYGAEPVRYYLMRKMAITHDSSFSIEDLEETITADLANDLGNLLNRMVALAHKHGVIELPVQDIWFDKAIDLRDECLNVLQDFSSYMDEYLYHRALARLWEFIHKVNLFFHSQEPWKLVKVDHQQFIQILSGVAHSLRVIAILLWPVMPHKMEQLLGSIGVTLKVESGSIEQLELGQWRQSFILHKIDTLFEKYEIVAQEAIKQKEESQKSDMKNAENNDNGYITIDDFVKIDLRIGTIVQSERVKDSTKMLVSQVDFGPLGMRQILSGIAQWYEPSQLIGKQGVFVVNLKSRMMLGLESQGMMLLAKSGDQHKMATVAEPVANGSRLS